MSESRKGFYFAANFPKGEKAGFMILPQNTKPFKIDNVEGTVTPKGITIFSKKKHYFFANEWIFFENKKISDIDKNKELRDWIEDTMKEWAIKHKRRPHPIFKENDVKA